MMNKILIVEDVEVNLQLLIQLLEDDYEIVSTIDGQQGVNLAISVRPNLIIMDMSLPVMDGWAATREIKSNPALSHIPVIGLSAHAMNGDRQKALEAGCDEYLTKPVDEVLLFDAIERFLSRGEQ